ncbi:hypothetical protein Tco_0194394 [Tanacetum coccineum]
MEYKKYHNRFASVKLTQQVAFRFQFRLAKIRSSNRFDKHIVLHRIMDVKMLSKRYSQYSDLDLWTMTLKITRCRVLQWWNEDLSKSSKGLEMSNMQKNSQKRHRTVDDQEAKEIKDRSQRDHASDLLRPLH